MDRHLRSSSFQRSVTLVRAVVLGVILLLSAVLLWTDAVAPLFVGSALTFGLAAMWCRWLEHHPREPAFAPENPSAKPNNAGP